MKRLLILCSTLLVAGISLSQNPKPHPPDLPLIDKILQMAQREHVSPHGKGDLEIRSIHGMLEALDPACGFVPQDRVVALRRLETKATIPAHVAKVDHYLTVLSPWPGAPKTLKPGIIIHRIDGRTTFDDDVWECLISLSGPQKSKVSLTLRDENGEENTVSIARVLPPTTIPTRKVGKALLLNLTTLPPNPAQAIMKATQSFNGPLILDLRNCGDRHVNRAFKLAQIFKSTPSLWVQNSKGFQEKKLDSDSSSPLSEPKVAILLGKWTCRAGEWLALSLANRENTRTWGENTMGWAPLTKEHILTNNGILILVVEYGARGKEKVLDRNHPLHPENSFPKRGLGAIFPL